MEAGKAREAQEPLPDHILRRQEGPGHQDSRVCMMEDKIKYARCAIAFFRKRHMTRPRFKKSSRNYEVPVYKEYVRISRQYIKKARAAGFRGSAYAEIKK
jgi:hypothetical protein